MRCNLYPAEEFGYHSEADIDESYVVAVRLDERGVETGEAYRLYLYLEDYMIPPFADTESMQRVDLSDRPAGIMPTIHNAEIREDGRLFLRISDDRWMMNEKQQDLLVMPLCVATDHGEYWVSEDHDRLLIRDESLQSVSSKTLDQGECFRILHEKFPELLQQTHTRYGNRLPELPAAKYFEEQDKTFVFVAKSQLDQISDRVLDGTEPFYRDRETGDKWNIRNTAGICIIDDTGDRYDAEVISPYELDLYIERTKEREKQEKVREPGKAACLDYER